ncbi:hypothetical protein GCK72_023794 [Caenorhabditis remanei]|uniref:Uncharacterized protein n=1 Tax=Caenorhabditis remanei TaxID=31234 RepID=A0A6A5FXT7_CAERE|nr:hypothetical protein GCK72_023794 [Caenorhabditis remanei]KAF1747332.1 hypothetical protein GCK72_023794 [Caenorhabditis remanei]
MGKGQPKEPNIEQSLVDLCKRTVAMNLLQCYPTPTVDEMSCEEWGNGTERTQSVTACQGCVELRKYVYFICLNFR